MTNSKAKAQHKFKGKPKSKGWRSITLASALALLTATLGLIPHLPTISAWVKNLFASVPYQVIPPVNYPKVIPYYLSDYYKNEGAGGPEKLYWFRSNMRNKTGDDVELVITFFLQSVHCEFVGLDQNNNAVRIDLTAGQTVPTRFRPPVQFYNKPSTDSCPLSVHYDITDVAGDKPYHGDAEIILLPPGKIRWDLTNVDHDPVSKEFLLASLTAWSLSKDGEVKKRGADLRNRASAPSPDWIKLCYDVLFQGQAVNNAGKQGGVIIIDPTGKTYPFDTETTLRDPGEILAAGRADPLEAAFLMASVINAATTTWQLPNRQVPMTLFILPNAKDLSHPAVLLGTRLHDGDSWEVVDLRNANRLGFHANLAQSQEDLRQILSQNPPMLQSLQDKGVFLTTEVKSPSALSFNQAQGKYGTLGLP